MPCYKPLKAWRSRSLTPSGKRGITFVRSEGFADLPVTLPCRQCVGCRLEYSRQWAIRCMHEAQMHEDNCFITLTYNDRYLPPDRSLHLDHFQKFMKRLRKRFGAGIRFYHCGEYGPKTNRPHYHACLFNHDFHDKKPWKISNGETLYRSPALESLWSDPRTGESYGYSSVGSLTFQSAAYVARYIMKKQNGDDVQKKYEYIDPDTGEIHALKPEYCSMSKRPHGIGYGWYEKYKSDIYPGDFALVNGKKVNLPAFYDRQYEIDEPQKMARVKRERRTKAKKHEDNNTPRRLKVRLEMCTRKIERLIRTIE